MGKACLRRRNIQHTILLRRIVFDDVLGKILEGIDVGYRGQADATGTYSPQNHLSSIKGTVHG